MGIIHFLSAAYIFIESFEVAQCPTALGTPIEFNKVEIMIFPKGKRVIMIAEKLAESLQYHKTL